MKIEGVAIVFDVLSEDLGGFRELVRPEAMDRTLNEEIDVRALVDHDTGKIIGRLDAGTLALRKCADGLHVEIWPPDTTVGRDIVASIAREDVFSMSFAFRALLDKWYVVETTPIREVLDMRVFEISPVVFAAYSQTSVGMRAQAVALERREQRGPLERRPAGLGEHLSEAKRRAVEVLRLCADRGRVAGVSVEFDEDGRPTIADRDGTPDEQRRWRQDAVGRELREDRARLAASGGPVRELQARQDRVAHELAGGTVPLTGRSLPALQAQQDRVAAEICRNRPRIV